jgi:hypothetical protein
MSGSAPNVTSRSAGMSAPIPTSHAPDPAKPTAPAQLGSISVSQAAGSAKPAELRRQPHRRPRATAHRGRDRPGHVPGGGVGSAGAGGVVLHRDRVARPGRACGRFSGQGQPGRGRGPAPAAGMDGRGRQRPVRGRGRGRGAGTETITPSPEAIGAALRRLRGDGTAGLALEHQGHRLSTAGGPDRSTSSPTWAMTSSTT